MTITRKQIYGRNSHYKRSQERKSRNFRQKRVSPSIIPPQNRKKQKEFNKRESIDKRPQLTRTQQKIHIQRRVSQNKSKKRSIKQSKPRNRRFKRRKVYKKGFKQRRTSQRKTKKTNINRFHQSKHRSNACIKNIDSVFKPIGSNLTKEDFKCIICFELPSLSDGRGVVICPTCHYPAHADEFKQWTRSSILCSRCEATLPHNYLNNPKVISASNYLKMIEKFVKS